MERRGVPGEGGREALARRLLKYVMWSSIFALPASTAASVNSVLGASIGVALGEESPDVFRLFKGLGGDISRVRLEGISIAVDRPKLCSAVHGYCYFLLFPQVNWKART
jgi:hypothetical protein